MSITEWRLSERSRHRLNRWGCAAYVQQADKLQMLYDKLAQEYFGGE